jgi:chromosome segregation ATPase
VLDKEQAELKLAESCEALKACSMRLDELQKDHAQQQTELSEHVSEKNNLERELQAVQKTLNAKIAELTDRLNEKTPDSVVQELQQALDAAVKQNNELDAGKQQMLQECANLKQQLETAMANCADIVQTKETQDKNFDELKKTYEELNLQYINLSADVDESSKLKQLLNELEMERSGFQKTNEVLLKQIEELQCSLSSVQLDKNKLTDEKAVLVEQLRLCGKMWEDVECSTQTNDPKLLAIPDEVNEIVKEVRAKINLRSEQLAKMQGENEMLNDAYLKLQNDYASLHHELASERCQTEQLLAEKDLLARELSQMKESYKELPVCSESNQPQLQSMNISESLQASAANMDEEFLKSTCQSDLSESADSGPVVHERDAEIKQFGNTESQKHELDHAEVSGKGSSLPLETSESKFEELCAETCSSGADGNSSSSLTPTACSETTDGVKSDLDELAVARQKLIEWEAMMLMLQAERTETQGELIKLQKQQEEALDAVSKLLQYILDTLLKDRDIFPSVDQNSVDDESAILSKLSLVKSIVEEMGFERDEMKEKIHHNIEEIAALNEKFASLLKEKEQLMEENVKLSGELESTQATRSHSSEKDAELLNSLKQIETERNDLQRQLDEKETKIQTLSGLVSDAEQLQLDMLAKEKLLADTNAEKEMWRDQCEGLQKRLDLCVTDSSSCVSDVQRLTSEVDRLLKENNHLSTDVQELTKDSQCNRMLFEEVQKKCEDECHRAAAIENALHKMQADFSACQEQNTSLMTKLGFAEKGNDDLQEENSKLTSSVSLLQERFDAAVAELEGVKCMKLTLENDMAALQVECKNRIESFEAQLVTASAKLTTAEEQLSDNASNLSRLEEELKQCREDLQVKCLSLQTAETELQNKTLELQQMHIALDQVKNASETNLQVNL